MSLKATVNKRIHAALIMYQKNKAWIVLLQEILKKAESTGDSVFGGVKTIVGQSLGIAVCLQYSAIGRSSRKRNP